MGRGPRLRVNWATARCFTRGGGRGAVRGITETGGKGVVPHNRKRSWVEPHTHMQHTRMTRAAILDATNLLVTFTKASVKVCLKWGKLPRDVWWRHTRSDVL